MSKIPKKDNTKTKKQESTVISKKKDVPNSQVTSLGKQTASTTAKFSSYVKEKTKTNEDKDILKTKSRVNVNKNLNELKSKIKTDAQTIAPPVAQQKRTSFRAKNTTAAAESIRKNSSSKANTLQAAKKRNAVLDTPHNVTVSSPPPKRNSKDDVKPSNNPDAVQVKQNVNLKLQRKNSRTLSPEEIVILKRDVGKVKPDKPKPSAALNTIKNPVAFEVQFKEETKSTRETLNSKTAKSINTIMDKMTVIENNEIEHNYSDDFEVYESDFETCSSSQSAATTDRSATESDDVSEQCSDTSSQSAQSQSRSDKKIDDSEDESELTQNPVTVIHKGNERKLDSGHYELNNFQKTNPPKCSDVQMFSLQHLADSVETFNEGTISPDQLDSGISAYEETLQLITLQNRTNIEISFGGYKHFFTKPIINQRAVELMSKTQFDVLSFTLLEFKPVSYDVFMQTYGKLNTQQSSTQTQDNLMDAEQQTDYYETRKMWTQHPVQYDVNTVKNIDQICCGESDHEHYSDAMPHCKLEQSLQTLKHLSRQSLKHLLKSSRRSQKKFIDYENLNAFLLRASLGLSQILSPPNSTPTEFSIQNTKNDKDEVLSRISDKYYYLETNFLNTLKVLKIFSNNKYNILITVHESLPDTKVYNSEFTNLLMVWHINITEKPLRLLTTWSEVSKIEISNDSSDIIVAALRDGSLALWDLRETYSFCSKLDGYLTHFAATQSVVPSLNSTSIKTSSDIMMDMGSCLDIKSFKCQLSSLQIRKVFTETQFASLHDSGVLTVWTLVQTSDVSSHIGRQTKSNDLEYYSKVEPTFEFISPWARIKLIQSTILNAKDYLETKSQHTQSRFDKTKTFFQKDIYNDQVLKELNQSSAEAGRQGLRLTSIECGSNNLFICTNRNFILMCSKTLKMDRLKRIIITESRFLFPTALKVLNNENFVSVGLSNGAVMILNCQSSMVAQNQENTLKIDFNKKDPVFELNSTELMGKSCAIQNIVLNSQKAFAEVDFSEQKNRPNTAALVSLIESKRQPFELTVRDQQVIMNGWTLRKNLIPILELSSDGWRLFALTNGHIRVYDFYSDKEITHQEIQDTGNIIDIATGKCGNNAISLIVLKPKTKVEIHILNN